MECNAGAGLFRQAIVYKNRNRDTTWYGMTDGDWPEIRAAFDAWTESDAFRMAHSGANPRKGTYLGHPKLETFESVL